MPRIGSSGKDDDLKRDRPPKPLKMRRRRRANRMVAALIMARGYKAICGFRQGSRRQTTRQSHSMIFAITSPNSSSAADQTSAETKLAAWKLQ